MENIPFYRHIKALEKKRETYNRDWKPGTQPTDTLTLY